ncbi:MAG: hypothetical protein WCV50_04235 [Patescibacteria group bacterium]|jgi:phosphomannomutase
MTKLKKTFKNPGERDKYLEDLHARYYQGIENATPSDYKNTPVFDLENAGPITLTLTKELVEKWNLEGWLANYKKEAEHSTGGIRGPQNILYPWDPRFPLNQIGVVLATLGKSLVLKEQIKNRTINKVVSGEVRYNTKKYIELISRIHAAQGVVTHQVPNNGTTAVWLVSFVIFMLDYDGGEYVTSSHAMSSKIATKDLDDQGSQFLPEMSLAFIAKIEEIIKKAKESPEGYSVTLAPKDDKNIVQDFDGYDLYKKYLQDGVATDENISLIKKAAGQGMRLMFETVGGCMNYTMLPLLKKFDILEPFEWNNPEEDPYFHGIGKTWKINPKTNKEEFFDLSCDACLMEVIETMYYEHYLKDKPIGYVVLITDPDGDRLVIGQVEPATNAKIMQDLGINYIKIDEEKIVSIYHPTFTFLMIMDFNMKQLKKAGHWNDHPRFMITTTPSSRAWDEWAAANGVKILTTPVGFKEIATIMKKVEKKLFADPQKEVLMDDVWHNGVNLGVDPRIAFAGEESGGMIIGPENPITSQQGRKALAMREKSAGEGSIIATALAAHLYLNKKSMAEYLQEIFEESNIKFRYYDRADITYYNESEPNPDKLLQEKKEGELKRDAIDQYCLGLALALKDKLITLEQAKNILTESMPELDFSGLQDILLTLDATYFSFNNMFVQIRRSGTDAKLRGYSNGNDRLCIKKYLDVMVNYSGQKTPLYDKLIPLELYNGIYDRQKKNYEEYLYKGL